MVSHFAGCSTAPFDRKAGCQSTSAPIMIPFIGLGSGKPICGYCEVTEIKTVPYVPLSHPFVERLIGSFVVLNKRAG